MSEEFNEKFETIEQTLKYIADSQAKSEWILKKSQKDWEKRLEESNQKFERQWQQSQKQLDYITKLTGIAFEDLMFQDEKIEEAGKALSRKNPKRT